MMSEASANSTPLASRTPLFWDISPEQVSKALRKNSAWAIVRIFEYGTIQDIYDAIDYYGQERTVEVLKHEKLKPVARVMAYLFLGVDPEHRYLRTHQP